MTVSSPEHYTFEVITASAIGAVHVDAGHLGEDSHGVRVGWLRGAPRVAMAVADGHGAAAHFRADVGAKYAVSALLEADVSGGDPCGFTASIVNGWRSRVANDIARNPISDRELVALTPWDQVDSRLNPVRAYGSTLVGAIIDGSQLTLVQLGDGDLFFASEGSGPELAFPSVARTLGDATHSLCMNRAAECMLTKIVDSRAAPLLVAAATDGIRNSLTDPHGLESFFSGLLRRSCELGIGGVRSLLSELVGRCASEGAGDDSTIVTLIRSDVFASMSSAQPALAASPADDQLLERRPSEGSAHCAGSFPRLPRRCNRS